MEIHRGEFRNLRDDVINAYIECSVICRRTCLRLMELGGNNAETIRLLQRVQDLSVEIIRLGYRPYSREEYEQILELSNIHNILWHQEVDTVLIFRRH